MSSKKSSRRSVVVAPATSPTKTDHEVMSDWVKYRIAHAQLFTPEEKLALGHISDSFGVDGDPGEPRLHEAIDRVVRDLDVLSAALESEDHSRFDASHAAYRLARRLAWLQDLVRAVEVRATEAIAANAPRLARKGDEASPDFKAALESVTPADLADALKHAKAREGSSSRKGSK